MDEMHYLITYRRDPSRATYNEEVTGRAPALDRAELLSKDELIPSWVDVWRLNQHGERTRLVAQFKDGAMYL